MGRVYANDPGDLGSIPDRVIPKTLKMVLDTSLLNIQQWKVRIKREGKVVAPSLTPRRSSYWKESLLVALDYSRQLYLLTQSNICTSSNLVNSNSYNSTNSV